MVLGPEFYCQTWLNAILWIELGWVWFIWLSLIGSKIEFAQPLSMDRVWLSLIPGGLFNTTRGITLLSKLVSTWWKNYNAVPPRLRDVVALPDNNFLRKQWLDLSTCKKWFCFVLKRSWTDQAKAKAKRHKEATKVNRGWTRRRE